MQVFIHIWIAEKTTLYIVEAIVFSKLYQTSHLTHLVTKDKLNLSSQPVGKKGCDLILLKSNISKGYLNLRKS